MSTPGDLLAGIASGQQANQPAQPAASQNAAPASTPGDLLAKIAATPDQGSQIVPADASATAGAMADAGVSDYKPGQGAPFGHYGKGAMTSSDVTPTQAELGAGAIAGTTAAVGTAAALPAVIPATVAGAKAINTWARANPVHAYLVLQLLREALPSFRKAVGIVKGSPDE